MSGNGPGRATEPPIADRTPAELLNRPGLASIGYRVGTYTEFRASMIAGLSEDSRPALRGLSTRETDDFSIALLDAWAVVGDVLTFYTERVANEHYLRTATERRSVAEQAALVGYRLRPGAAASAWIAVTLETAPGAPAGSAIPAGTRMQTIAGPGELPQVFETTEQLAALAAWNRPEVAMLESRPPTDGATVLLAGVETGLRRGDRLLFVDEREGSWKDGWATARVLDVAVDPIARTTLVSLQPPSGGLPARAQVHALRSRAALFGYNAPNPRLFDERIRAALPLDPETEDWRFEQLTAPGDIPLDGLYEGAGAPGYAVLQKPGGAENVLARVTGGTDRAKAAYAVSARVTALTLDETSAGVTEFGGSSTRETMVSFQSELLPLAPVPRTEPLFGGFIPLARPVPAVDEVRRVLIRGARPRIRRRRGRHFGRTWPSDPTPIVLSVHPVADRPGQFRWALRPGSGNDLTVTGPELAVEYLPARPDDPRVGEAVLVAPQSTGGLLDRLELVQPLRNVYDRLGPVPIELFGNVVEATHGESAGAEVLGSGDGGQAFQRFTLRRKLVTHVPAATPTGTGTESTLRVWVNDILWREVPTLFGAGPHDRVYTTAIDDSGTTTITFGDGVSGARLPTGSDNVVARYRVGLGLAGAARAEQIALPLTKPLGLKSVSNPLPAGGAQDAQRADDARSNAPRSVLTLGRVVALQDYADFAGEFAGVAKATATWTWDTRRRGVHLTIAAADGKPLPDGSTLLDDLRAALRGVSARRVPLEIRDFEDGRFGLLARLRIAGAFDAEQVRSAVAARLLSRYAFAERAFGAGVALSEIAHIIHGVPGVEAVRIDRLHRTRPRSGEPAGLDPQVPAVAPRPGGPPSAAGAEILTLSAEHLTLETDW